MRKKIDFTGVDTFIRVSPGLHKARLVKIEEGTTYDGDDGSNTIKQVPDIKALQVKSVTELKQVQNELKKDTTYKTVIVDTFGLMLNEWIDENSVKKNKKMTMNMWGEVKVETEEIIKKFSILSKKRIVVLTCHETINNIEGMEEEIAPGVHPSASRGAISFLEGMSNYGIHTTIIQKDVEQEDGTTIEEGRHAIHLGTNTYYWTKTQKPADIRLPHTMYNPSYNKIMKYLTGERRKKNES